MKEPSCPRRRERGLHENSSFPGCRLAPRLWAMDGAEVRFATIVSTLGVRQFETVMVMPELVPLTSPPYEATLCSV